MKRTHTCGQLSEKELGKKVIIQGWVDRRRDHGQLIFLDVRDRYGITQVVINPQEYPSAYKAAQSAGKEFVIEVAGKVEKRPKGTENDKMAKTGNIELHAESVTLLNTAAPMPIDLSENSTTSEDTRLQYRYLDLRRPIVQEKILLRHRIIKTIRDYFDTQEFVEVETPLLAKSTPEGSRDYLVPSRIHPGKFYALPQSPQLFKQMLMVAGFDRYFQIARCLRDEDLRADRQPEFTQLDVEMSFPSEEDLYALIEGCLKEVFEKVVNKKIKTPFVRMPYDEAMSKFGSDKPDLRFGLEMQNLNTVLASADFNAIKETLAKKGIITGLCASNAGSFTRKEIDELSDVARIYGAKGVFTLKVVNASTVEGTLAKGLDPKTVTALISHFKAKKDDLLIIIADEKKVSLTAMGQVRIHLGKKLNLIDPKKDAFLWVTDFPLFQYSAEEKRIVSEHHPFTAPKEEQWDLLEKDPLAIRARCYDVVWNGYEIGGGSIRIHNPTQQMRIFRALGLSEAEAKEKFGFMLQSFSYGAPPHGGLAMGIDRIVMLLTGAESLREVVAFPKNKSAISPMENAPSEVSEQQLQDLHLLLNLPKKTEKPAVAKKN